MQSPAAPSTIVPPPAAPEVLNHAGSAVGAGPLAEVPVTPPAVVVVQYHPAGGSAPATFATPPYHHYHLHQQHVHSHPYHHHHYHVHDPYLQHHAMPPFAAPPVAFPFAPGYHHHTQAYQAAYHQGHWPPYPVSVTAQTHVGQEQPAAPSTDRPVLPTPTATQQQQLQQQQPQPQRVVDIRVLPDTTQLRAPPPGRSDRQLIVNYLDDEVTSDELVRIFSTVGSVESARVMRDAATNAPQGYGFVYMATAEDAARAMVQLDRYKLRKKRLKVAYATPRRDAERRCEPQTQDSSDRSPPPGGITNSNSATSSARVSANASSQGVTGTSASTTQRNPSSTDADGTDGSSGSSRDDAGRAGYHYDR